MAKHTPGPWINVGPGCNSSGSDVYTTAAMPRDRMIGYSESWICTTNPNGQWCSYRDPVEQMANARLIAAAPELLTSLKALIGLVRDGFHPEDPSVCRALREAQGAVRKATRD
jgi:hypothetical protein